MFVETSAVVSMVTRELGFEAIADQIDNAELAVTSPVVILEASMVIASRLNVAPDEAEGRVRAILDAGGVVITAIDDETASLAVQAFQRYGKGRGHPARLNLGSGLIDHNQ